eukprot:gene5239-8837_t
MDEEMDNQSNNLELANVSPKKPVDISSGEKEKGKPYQQQKRNIDKNKRHQKGGKKIGKRIYDHSNNTLAKKKAKSSGISKSRLDLYKRLATRQ